MNFVFLFSKKCRKFSSHSYSVIEGFFICVKKITPYICILNPCISTYQRFFILSKTARKLNEINTLE